MILAAFCGPLSWTHHFLGPLLLVPGLVALWPGAAGWAMVALAGLAQSVPVHFLLNPADRPDGPPILAGVVTWTLVALAFALAPRQNGRTTLPE
jgi:hypothetical protein